MRAGPVARRMRARRQCSGKRPPQLYAYGCQAPNSLGLAGKGVYLKSLFTRSLGATARAFAAFPGACNLIHRTKARRASMVNRSPLCNSFEFVMIAALRSH